MECDQYALQAAESIAQSEPGDSQLLRAIIHAELAFAWKELSRFDLAWHHAKSAEGIFRDLEMPGEVARALRYQAHIAYAEKNLDAAAQLCTQALQLLEDDKDSRQDDRALVTCYTVTTPLDLRFYPPDTQDNPQRSSIYSLLGQIDLTRGEYGTARVNFVRAIQLARTYGEGKVYWSLAPALGLGLLHERRGRRNAAALYFRRCIRWTDDGTRLDIRAEAMARLGQLLALSGDFRSAKSLWEKSVRYFDLLNKFAEKRQILSLMDSLTHFTVQKQSGDDLEPLYLDYPNCQATQPL